MEAIKKEKKKQTPKKPNINYSGNVKVTVKSGKKTISVKNYHNHGYNNLFRFICECLAGNYQTADRRRPLRIRAFYNEHAETGEIPDIARAELDKGNLSRLIPISGYISTDTSPLVEELIPQNGSEKSLVSGFKTTFHFMIPYAYLANSSKPINQIILYSNNKLQNNLDSELDSILAYYLFTDDSSGIEEWASEDISNYDENTNLIIEWSMIISNNEN